MDNDYDVAIVGMACRLPGARNPEEFWQNLIDGVESITRLSDQELIEAGVDSAFLTRPDYVKAAPVLDDPELFDAAFFGFSPSEASTMDPQHRLILELAHTALEDAACDPDRFPGRIGVFTGSAMNTYFMNSGINARFVEDYIPTLIVNDKDFISTRISYKLGLRGPSMTVQTACSTSLVAIHLARQSLLNEETDIALAGAVSVRVPHRAGYFYDSGGLVSPDGHVRTFDAGANGTVFGSGAGVIVMRRLADALAHGDQIYAVIKGSAVNNDGSTKAGYTAPSINGQADVIVEALANAGVDAESISYIEAHGSGTPVGDPIEIFALTKAFRNFTQRNGFCAVGSVKTNVGHLDAAAGMVGLIKTVLALKHRKLPPSLHYSKSNPEINFPDTPFYVNAQLAEWKSKVPRRAGVMSTGMGGTNAHVILEEAPQSAVTSQSNPPYLLVLSAKNEKTLDLATQNLREFLKSGEPVNMNDVSYTLQVGRKAYSHRRFVVCNSQEDAASALNLKNSRRTVSSLLDEPAQRPLVFLLPGIGDHYVGMGADLYEQGDIFKQEVDRCARILEPHLGIDIREVIYPQSRSWKKVGQSKGIDLKKMLGREDEVEDVDAQKLNQTLHAQPAMFTIEYALARMWYDLGVVPDAIVGHSLGEYVAACLAGVFSLDDALRLVACRARLVNELPQGAMLAVPLPEKEILPLLNEELSISLINGPNLCVVAGPVTAMSKFGRLLKGKDINYRPVKSAHAFHSKMLDPIVKEFEAEVKKVQLKEPKINYASNITGGWISKTDATDPAYWARHVNHTARFSDALHSLWQFKDPILLEIGPGKALGALAMQHPARGETGNPVVVSTLRPHYEHNSDVELLLQSIGRLWLSRVKIDWSHFRKKHQHRFVSLPTYPFDRQRYWIEKPNAGVRTVNGPCLPANDAPPVSTGKAAMMPITPTQSENQPNIAVTNCALASHSNQGTRRDRLASRLRRLIKELSGVEVVSDTDSFTEMGFESLFLTQASQLFQSRFRVKVSFRQMLDELSTISALARYLDEQMPANQDSLEWEVQAKIPAAVRRSATPQTDVLQVVKQPVRSSGGSGFDISQGTKRFGPYKPLEKGERGSLNARQQKALDELIVRYVKKTAGSKRYSAEHRPHFADPRAVSGFKSNWKEMVYPIVSDRSKGSKIWDIDGNEYVDITMGFGIYLFGHSPDWLIKALQDQLRAGIAIGPQSQLAGEVARLVCDFTGMERVSFCNTGSEAVMAAIRLARMITGRKRVVFFNGDYHGMFEEVLVRGAWENGEYRAQPAAPGIPASLVENMLVLEYGEPESLEIIQAHASEIAAVLIEPVRSRQPGFQPRAFMHSLRTITEQTGAALIFDEMVTGFRCHPGGAQAYFGVQADMATYGKVLGGGIPIGILAGKRKFMDGLDGGAWNYGDDSFPEVGVTFFAGTFVRHPLAITAAWQVLNHLKEQGPKLQLELSERVARFCRTLNEHFEWIKVPIRLSYFSSYAMIEYAPDLQFISLLWYYLREKGIHAWENRTCYFTLAHSDEDFDRLIAAFKNSVTEMQAGGFLPESNAAQDYGISNSAMGFPRYDTAPVTEAQREILLAAIMNNAANCVYNQCCTIHFKGSLNILALEKSIQQIFDRHQALRSTFSADLQTQIFHPSRIDKLSVVDKPGLPETERMKKFDEFVNREMTTPFDLERGPMVRLKLFKFSEEYHRLVMTAHHVICDGWSSTLIIFDLSRIYNAIVAGEIPLLPPPNSFADFARDRALEKGDSENVVTEQFWLDQFADGFTALNLPSDRPRPSVRTYSGNQESRIVNPELFARLKKATPHLGGTLFATLFGAYAVFLHRLTSQNDIVIGVPAAGQAVYGCDDLVGHCVNFLPIRVQLSGQMPFSEFARAVKNTVLDAYDHQKYTYGTLVQKLKLPRVLGRPPLISAMFNIDKSGFDVFGFEQLDFQVTYNAKRHVNFDLFFNLIQTETSLEVECEYNSDLFDNETIVRWLTSFETLIEAIVTDDCTPVDFLPLISKKEKQMILVEWNKTEAAYPQEKTLHALLAEQAKRVPDAIALVHEGGRLTYRELDQRANQLANRLRTLGVGPNVLVGVCLFRSVEMVVGLLGILKAGGAYVPMDPEYPHDRLAFMLENAGVRVLLTEQRLLASLPPHDAKVICLDSEWLDIAKESDNPPIVPMVATELAYIIYTSGSTGRPKGVQIEHRSVVAFATWARRVFTDEEFAGVMFSTSICFDLSVFELFVTLVNGGKVILAKNVLELPTLPTANEVRLVNTVPSAIAELARTNGIPRSVITVNLAGEPLPQSLVDKLYTDCFVQRVYDLYGPTETTTYSAYTLRQRGGKTTIGRPIANTRIHILDRHYQPTPIGVPGELHIGGIGLARGYHNQPELTAEKFISDPFEIKPEALLYKTGDMARYLADGNIEYLGRLDHQVKIRGIRIELNEIESVLDVHPSVRKAVVVAREDVHGDKQLVTYMTGKNGVPPKASELRDLLKAKLPEYMMPAAFITLEQFPLTPNGKVDRKALPMPEFKSAASQFVPPSTPTEAVLAKIWCEILALKEVGIHDNFFDLGGHSLLAMRVIVAIRKGVGKAISLRSLFTAPTIFQLSKAVDGHTNYSVTMPSVGLRGNGTGAPLFYIPGIGGYGFLPPGLAQHLKESCRYYDGLQYPGLNSGEPMPSTIEEIAAHLVTQIQSIWPHGPYYLCGWSLGGSMAFEVARQMETRGVKVQLVLLLDSRCLGPTRQHKLAVADIVDRLQRRLSALNGLERAIFLRNLAVNKLRALFFSIMRNSGTKPEGDTTPIMEATLQATRKYRPGYYGGKVVLFQIEDWEFYSGFRYAPDPTFGWDRLVGQGSLHIIRVPGDHKSMLNEPAVSKVAEKLLGYLQQDVSKQTTAFLQAGSA